MTVIDKTIAAETLGDFFKIRQKVVLVSIALDKKTAQTSEKLGKNILQNRWKAVELAAKTLETF